QFSLSGIATVGISGSTDLSVTFGHGSTPGLVVTNGALTSLDTTVNTGFTIKGVTFTVQDLDFSYTASTDEFGLSGTATVAVAGIANLSVTFGHGSTPGLVVSGGALVSLDTTINASFTVASVPFTVKDLDFSYTASTGEFDLSGTATATVAKLGDIS